MSVSIYRDDRARAIFINDPNGSAFLNQLLAVEEDDGTLTVMDESRDIALVSHVAYSEVVDADGVAYGASLASTVNALNAIFSEAGAPVSTNVPTITSATAISIVTGNTLNYELTADFGVSYEWSGIPAGVSLVEGSQRKLIGGSGLAPGVYNMTATAINYYGATSETITLTVSNPAFADTYSVEFNNQQYLNGSAAAVDGVLGRPTNNSGDAWSASFWFKSDTSRNRTQTILGFGDTDQTNGGHLLIAWDGNDNRIYVRYGSASNFLEVRGSVDSGTKRQWDHYLVTFAGGSTDNGSGGLSTSYGQFRIFLNGTEVTYDNTHSNFGYSGSVDDDRFYVGRGTALTGWNRQGRLNEVALWGTDQSANVAAIYNAGSTHDLSLLASPPTHWWRMGDGDTYPTLTDNAGSADLTAVNMTIANVVSDTP